MFVVLGARVRTIVRRVLGSVVMVVSGRTLGRRGAPPARPGLAPPLTRRCSSASSSLGPLPPSWRPLELERQWLTGSPSASNADSDAERCAKLEKAIAELKRQQHALQAEMRAVRGHSPFSILFGRKRSSAADRARQLEDFVASAQEDLNSLRIIRNHVQAFATKKISLTKFVRGPKELEFDIDQLHETALGMVRNEV